MKLHRLTAKGIIFILLLSSAGPLFADENNDGNWWNLKVGSKGVYNSGISEPYTYYSLYGEGILDIDWLKATVNGAHDFSSQISSGLGEYQYIDVNKISLKAELSPNEILSAGGEYYTGRGDSSYQFHEWDAFLRIGPEAFNLEIAYGASSSQYLFNDIEIEIKRKNASVALAMDFSDELSADITYERSSLEFSNLGYEYLKNSVRAGIFLEVNDSLFITGGLSGGNDSADYVILGADGGIIVVLFSHVRLSGMYFFEQYITSVSTTSESTKKTGSGGGIYSSNPYLQSSKAGESFPSHRVSVGIVYSLH